MDATRDTEFILRGLTEQTAYFTDEYSILETVNAIQGAASIFTSAIAMMQSVKDGDKRTAIIEAVREAVSTMRNFTEQTASTAGADARGSIAHVILQSPNTFIRLIWELNSKENGDESAGTMETGREAVVLLRELTEQMIKVTEEDARGCIAKALGELSSASVAAFPSPTPTRAPIRGARLSRQRERQWSL